MCAELIKFGESPPSIGGEFEKEIATLLCEKLSHRFLIITNPCFPTRSSFFYEYDIVLLSPFFCEVIEIKYIYTYVDVYEDWLVSIKDFQIPSVFSLVETKAKVLTDKLRKQFGWREAPFVKSRVIVGPESTKINYKFELHKKNRKLVKPFEAIEIYKGIEKSYTDAKKKIKDFKLVKEKFRDYSNNLSSNTRKKHKLGRFYLKRVINQSENYSEYWAADEPPCSIDVYLKEYPFNQLNKREDIEIYLKKVTRGMQILRGLRHQYINCVIGHFQTGCSLVQINDWFDGKRLSDCWKDIKELNLSDKTSIMIKIVQGIGFCHTKGVFHRNINSKSILISSEFDDIRITGFDYAKDLEYTDTMTSHYMKEREGKIIPPEEILAVGKKDHNLRLYDIYQTGILFYRIFENGCWPFDNSLEYCTEQIRMRKPLVHIDETGGTELKSLIQKMISIDPSNRPDLMQKIEDDLIKVLEICCR